MYVRPSHIASIALAFIVFSLLGVEAYLLFLKHKFTGTRIATHSACTPDAHNAIVANGERSKDVYVNCSGFQG